MTRVVPSATYPTIQSALNAAATGDTVLVSSGTYLENLIWPATELSLIGAGVGLSIIDGTQNGSCIRFNTTVSHSIVDGFTFTNGSGTWATNGAGLIPMGGALHILQTVAGPAAVLSPIIRNCRFTNNSAQEGGAISVRFAGVTLENCKFDNNSVVTGGRGSCGFFQAQPWHTVTMRGCEFGQHTQAIVCEWDPSFGSSSVEISDSVFEQNTVPEILAISGNVIRLLRNKFINNVVSSTVVLALQSPTAAQQPFVIESSVFADNIGDRVLTSLAGANVGTGLLFANNTVARNTTTLTPLSMGGGTQVTDCIIKGNKDPSGVPYANPFSFPSGASTGFFAQNSNLQGMSGSGPGIISVAALFVDGPNGDYRLRPGSPMIDAGTVNPLFSQPLTDVRGLPRVRGGTVDMGAYEAQSLAHHPASAGRVGQNAGGPFDILTMNGSKGDIFRRVEIPIGGSASIEMAQPVHLAAPRQLSVFGILGEANFDSVINVPLGIGDMMFAPAPMLPFLHPSFFTMASSVGPLGFYAPIFPATPTPWLSGLGASLPFPLLITLQGVLEESPGVFVPTNALIFEVK